MNDINKSSILISIISEYRCPHNLPLHWKETDQCFAEFTRGPCEVNQYLVTNTVADAVTNKETDAVSKKKKSVITRKSVTSIQCVDTKHCDTGSIFWPPDQTCYPLYTQEEILCYFEFGPFKNWHWNRAQYAYQEVIGKG